MKVRFYAQIMVDKKCDEWCFAFIPTVLIDRDDVFADEKRYRLAIIIFAWHIMFEFRMKKQ